LRRWGLGSMRRKKNSNREEVDVKEMKREYELDV